MIRALTDKLQSDIQAGLNKAISASGSSGGDAGRAFSDAFNANGKIGIPSSFESDSKKAGERGGAVAGAAVAAGVAGGMTAGAAKGSQAVVAAAGRAGGSAGSVFSKMFNSSGGGSSRIFISMALRIAALLPILGALVGGISSVVSGLFAMGAAANNAIYAFAPLPGLVAALVQGGAVLMTAFSGVGTALSAGLKQVPPPAAQTAKALDGLKNAARDAAEAVRDAAEAVSDAREAISDAAEGIRDAREAVSDAAKALRDAEEAAAEAIVNANQAVADAKRNRREVHEDAAEAEREAIERVQDAEEDLANSHKNVQKAQEALTDARKAAQERLLDLQFATRGGAIAEQRAIMSLADARYKLNATAELPADNRLRQEAQLAFDEAQLNLEMTQERNGDTAESLQEIREQGVDGTDEVVAAQERLVDAQDDVNEAIEGVSDALSDQREMHQNVAEAIRDSNEAVKEAKQALRDAFEDAPEMVSDAREALSDAKEGLSDAKEALSDAQESLSDALTALADAKKNVGEANTAFAAGVPEVNAYQQALDKLSPAAQKFVEFLISIRERMGELKTAAASGLFPGLQTAIENIVYGPLFPALRTMMYETGVAVADAAISISESLSTGPFVKNFGDVAEGNNKTISRMGLVIGDLAAALFAFMAAAQPVTDMFTGWLVQWSDQLRVTTELGNANGTLTTKLLAGAEVMKQLIDITKNLWEGFSDLGGVADKSGQSLLDSFEKATEKFANFTDNKENVKQLRKDFDNIADNLRAIGDLALVVGGAFFRLGADPAIGKIAKLLEPVVITLENLITGLLDEVGDDLVLLVDQILIAFDEISKSGAIQVFLQTMSTALSVLIKAFQDPIFGPILRTLVKIGAAMYALSILTKFPGISLLVKILPTLATVIGRVMLAMGPIGWIITAIGLLALGFKILYERSETFRGIVDPIFVMLKAALNTTMKVFGDFGIIMKAAFEIAVDAAKWLWDVLFGHSIFPDIQEGFEKFLSAVGGIFDSLAHFFTVTIPDAAGKLFTWLDSNWPLILAILTGPFGLAVLAISKNWDKIKDGFTAAKDWVVDKFAGAWSVVKDKILKPIDDARGRVADIFGAGGPVRGFFSGIKDWVIDTWSTVWGKIKDKILGPIDDARTKIGEWFGEGGPIRNFFGGIKDWIVNTWSTSWDKIKDTILTPIENAKNKIVEFFDFTGKGGPIKQAFTDAVAGIKTVWDGIQAIAAKPVNFVIESVYNNGLRKALNYLPGVNLAEASQIEGYAGGGVLPGWSPGRDIHQFVSPTAGRLALSGGEAIMRPEFTRAVGGEAGVNRLNAMARKGMAFAKGGVFRPVAVGDMGPIHPTNATDIALPVGLNVVSIADGYLSRSYDIAGPLPTDRYHDPKYGPYGSYGRVIMINHDGGFSSLYAHLSRRIATGSGQRIAAGEVIGKSGSTGNSSGPHLHFGVTGTRGPFDFNTGARGSTGTASSGPAPGEEEKQGWLDRIKNIGPVIKGVYDDVTSMGGKGGYYPLMGDAARGSARNAVQWANDKIPDSISIPGPNIPLPKNPILNPFDRGGVASGQTDVWMPKRTARPERVLSPDQTVAFERLVAWLDKNGGAGGQGGDINIDVHVPQEASARDVVESIVYEMRRQQAGGKYING